MTAPTAPSFRLHVSNRLEELAAALAEEMRARPGDPLAAERIVVPHPGLGRWLALELASRLGIAAHLKLELPAEFAWSLMRTAIVLPREQPFAAGALRWRIFDVLEDWEQDDDLTRYLADADPRKRFAVADRLAHVYDRCLLYRPQWIRAWQGGETPHWQARVWRELAPPGPVRHWVEAVDAFQRATRGGARQGSEQLDLFEPAPASRASSDGEIDRVSFFAVPSLSPSYLSMLRAAGSEKDVHLFQLSPCREFWADTRSRRELPPVARQGAGFTEGNELLAAWGRAARDMQALLADDLGLGDPHEAYRAPDAPTRLGRVQSDILDLRLSTEASETGVPPDDSIQIHVCHSATREAEVLHDRLLGLFDAHEDIQPADVLILTPDMDEYAPAIEAVFDSFGEIPFNIARLRRRDSAAVRAFLDLLALPGSRYPVSAVLAPLRAASVAAQFRLVDADLPDIRTWIGSAGIHWGIGEPGGQRSSASDVPASARHTWHEGLRRLLLGYAIEGSADWFAGVASSALDRFGSDGPDRYERLGRFARYCELAFALEELADEALPAAEWAACLRERVLAPFFAAAHPLAEVAREADLVSRLIEELEAEWRVAGTDGAIPFAVVRDVLGELGAASSRAVARLADGVTVAPLAAGQVFPAKVVCAVGMNDRAFPRHRAPASFDVVGADSRRAGDRDPRDEDRLAFLEALLGARRAFVVTYTGRDLREDAAIPPSVVVSELLDYLGQRFPDEEAFAVEHPLQPFNRRYFEADDRSTGGQALFSYSETMAQAAMAVRNTPRRSAAPHRLAGTLAQPDRLDAEVELAELVRFAAHPVRHFARNRLGLRLEIEDEDPATDEEPLELNYLEQWQLKDQILGLTRRELTDETTERLTRARGLLPPGNLGANEHQRGAIQVATLRQALDPYAEHLDAPPTPVDVDVGGIRLTGRVEGFVPEAGTFLWWRVGRIREKDRIEAWLRLLALSSAMDAPVSAQLVGVTNAAQRDVLRAPNPEAVREMLGRWLEAWQRAASEPLPFFPKTSLAWAETQDSWKAEKAWHDGQWSESQDVYNRLLCPDGPYSDGFERLAGALLGPLVEQGRGE